MATGHCAWLAAFLLLACGGGTPKPANPEPKAAAPDAPKPEASAPEAASPPAESDQLRVIFEKDQVAEYFRTRGGNEKPGTHFAPTRADIEKLEAALPGEIKKQQHGVAAISPPLWERVKEYKRQYVPYVDASGARFIWGNFMCTNPGRPGSDTWRKKVVRPTQGGECFFHVEYSPDSGSFRRFTISDED
ncbi:MAG: hypothetical protein U0263_02500 [Polyangiaceae bacterium]